MSETEKVPVLPEGPASPPLVQLLNWLLRPVPFLEECQRRYGDDFTIRFYGFPPLVFFSSPEAVQQIFRAPGEVMRSGNVSLEYLIGEHSLLLLDGPRHLQHRRLMLPAFQGERHDQYFQTIRDIARRTLASWHHRRRFALHREMQLITLEVVLRTVFGFEEDAEVSWLLARFPRFLELMSKPLLRFNSLQVELGGLAPWGQAMRLKREIDARIYAQIAETRAAVASGATRRSDILTRFVEARDEEGAALTDDELRDEMMTLLVAGHETTALSLTWVFYRLLRHPEVCERVTAEVREVVGEGPLQPEHLRRLAYTEAVFKETLRLNPVFPLVIRRIAGPVRIGGYDLGPGIFVAPCLFLAHRRPEAWQEPLEFRPERFLDERTDGSRYFPFGGGTHGCIGPPFAVYEMKIVLAEILSAFRMRSAARRPTRIVRRGVTLAPSSGLPVEVEPLGG